MSNSIQHDDAVPVGPLSIYGNVNDANNYFNNKLNSSIWSEALTSDKNKALTQATKAIDQLNFKHKKTDSGQSLQFPRNGDDNIPEAINFATYEEAYQILSGKDSELEQNNVNVVSRSFAAVRTTYDRSFISENVRAGIISQVAWSYLVPYLRDANALKLVRVN